MVFVNAITLKLKGPYRAITN